MQKQKPVSVSGSSADTQGMDGLFTETMSDDTADIRKPKTIEVPIAESLEIAVTLAREATPEKAEPVRWKKPSTGEQRIDKPLQREGTIDPFAK